MIAAVDLRRIFFQPLGFGVWLLPQKDLDFAPKRHDPPLLLQDALDPLRRQSVAPVGGWG
jgi:hypothetical protein